MGITSVEIFRQFPVQTSNIKKDGTEGRRSERRLQILADVTIGAGSVGTTGMMFFHPNARCLAEEEMGWEGDNKTILTS